MRRCWNYVLMQFLFVVIEEELKYVWKDIDYFYFKIFKFDVFIILLGRQLIIKELRVINRRWVDF